MIRTEEVASCFDAACVNYEGDNKKTCTYQSHEHKSQVRQCRPTFIIGDKEHYNECYRNYRSCPRTHLTLPHLDSCDTQSYYRNECYGGPVAMSSVPVHALSAEPETKQLSHITPNSMNNNQINKIC